MYQRRPIAATTPSSPHNVSPAERRTTRPHHHNVQDNTTFIHNPAPRNVSPTNTSLTHSLNMPDTMSLSRSYPSMKSPLLSPSRIPVRTRANTLPASSRAELQYTHTDFIAEIEEMQRLQAENARLLEQNSRVNGITEAYAELGMRSEAQEMTIHVLEQCLQSSDGDLKAARDEVVRMSDDLIRTQHINAMLGEQLEAAQKIVEKHKEREKDTLSRKRTRLARSNTKRRPPQFRTCHNKSKPSKLSYTQKKKHRRTYATSSAKHYPSPHSTPKPQRQLLPAPKSPKPALGYPRD
ncbi:hypothetical protein BU26DRAFT_519092 [Trematosphaeria pertusa]|uniref:Uncharacterized protein n=1 Tax=Trematosphaeria pertusa TaxID=390896 RepID=A0A6A6IFM7_9PLEO|nr:uncharacterized protein BU26DRAFT_519092 [Trematosphaeria pertusa]KAF2248888.1 hypothetical protein BU26DRAFT_519092 [Trematosphaeria pertusa]